MEIQGVYELLLGDLARGRTTVCNTSTLHTSKMAPKHRLIEKGVAAVAPVNAVAVAVVAQR